MSRLTRQSFLGPTSDDVLAEATVGLVGLGGGGSHIAQQAGHAGIGGYVLVDPDVIDEGNTNRLIGGTLVDVRSKLAKTAIAARIIRSLNPRARITEIRKSWHEATDTLKACDIIIGAVNSFREREQLERLARRYMIPYIDIGMDVHEIGKGAFLIAARSFSRHLAIPACAAAGSSRTNGSSARLSSTAPPAAGRRSSGRMACWHRLPSASRCSC